MMSFVIFSNSFLVSLPLLKISIYNVIIQYYFGEYNKFCIILHIFFAYTRIQKILQAHSLLFGNLRVAKSSLFVLSYYDMSISFKIQKCAFTLGGVLICNMKIIGLTGSIATGKSTVSQVLAQRGYEIIDADAVVHELQAKGSPLLSEIVKAFDPTILHEDGSLNRGELGKIIFGNALARAKLDGIVHPAVRAEFERRILTSKAEILFLDVPLLFEAGFDDMTAANLVISASEEVQLKRLMLRDGFSKEEAQARIRSQMAMCEKVARADYVIDNSGDLCELEKNVDRVLGEIKRSGD